MNPTRLNPARLNPARLNPARLNQAGLNIFVYGTLMSGMGLNSYLQDAKFIGPAITLDKYSLHSSGFIPFLHDDEHEYKVKGEVYQISGEILKELDNLEGNGDWYLRKKINVLVDDGTRGDILIKNTSEESKGVIYLVHAYINNEVSLKLPHGDFRLWYLDQFLDPVIL